MVYGLKDLLKKAKLLVYMKMALLELDALNPASQMHLTSVIMQSRTTVSTEMLSTQERGHLAVSWHMQTTLWIRQRTT